MLNLAAVKMAQVVSQATRAQPALQQARFAQRSHKSEYHTSALAAVLLFLQSNISG